MESAPAQKNEVGGSSPSPARVRSGSGGGDVEWPKLNISDNRILLCAPVRKVV